ncbi:MAG: metallophosphoesterase [Bacteroidetes bacterium]|jgi:hypothetical protein|nr:metallophosphoesterase [Bacteroidota bacterium]
MSSRSIISCAISLFFCIPQLFAQDIPTIYSNITYFGDSLVFIHPESGDTYPQVEETLSLTLEQLIQAPQAGAEGLNFDFSDSLFNGTLYYGFIPTKGIKYPQPVWFKQAAKVEKGQAQVNIAALSGKYDIIDWETNGYGLLAYRLVNQNGLLIYDGRIAFEAKDSFSPALTICEGPFVVQPTAESVIITFKTNQLTDPTISVGRNQYQQKQRMANLRGSRQHEILIDKLQADSLYTYQIKLGVQTYTYSFRTAPTKGSRSSFRFAYASDSREGKGGGERSLFGTNAYIMKKIAALANREGTAFWQFTGDLITGYSTSVEATQLQYANWKRAIEPFWHHIPVYTAMGNHEAMMTAFGDLKNGIAVDNFPFKTQSAERLFADEFCNPVNGPVSEDGTSYDPVPDQIDFPSYQENVYYYTYDNVAMIVLNSDYWYAPSTAAIPYSSGNAHGYLMDKQLEWYSKTTQILENDSLIDHIFVSFHTPMFPNGGHSHDDMWYSGNNDIRPFIAGNPVANGIIERRDKILDIMVNQSLKTRAVLCGDEHNYSRLHITNEMLRYPEDWELPRLQLSRDFWQITNGSAGAPYYGQEKLPWSDHVAFFSLQYALVFFDIQGHQIQLEVVNPDTYEIIERFVFYTPE